MTETNNTKTMNQPIRLQLSASAEQMHEEIDKRIAGCVSALVCNLGDPMTVEHGILSTLSYSFKEQLLKEMREALQ